MGAGYARHKQFIKAAIMTVLEAAVILFSILFASQYVPKFGTLGTVQAEMIFDPVTMKNIMNDYDNSFKILLYSLICFVVWIAFFFVWIKNTINSYKIQVKADKGEHINTFIEDIRMYKDEKFHITLLTLPVLGIVILQSSRFYCLYWWLLPIMTRIICRRAASFHGSVYRTL